MIIKCQEHRSDTLQWVKRPTQKKEAATNPTATSLWAHLLVAINDIIIQDPNLSGSKQLKFPFGERNIRKDGADYSKIRAQLAIADDVDLKNLWPRLNAENLQSDFELNEHTFSEIESRDESMRSIRMFVNDKARPDSSLSRESLISAHTGLTNDEAKLIIDKAITYVCIYVYGLVSQSIFGHAYRKHVLNATDRTESLTKFIEQNENLLRIFAHDKDYAARGTNDVVAVINSYYHFCMHNNSNYLSDNYFTTIHFPSLAFLKEIDDHLQYFELKDLCYELAINRKISPPITLSDSTKKDSIKNNDEPILMILQGPPGTGKTRYAREEAKRLNIDSVRICQFHPSYAYEQFVEGIQPVSFIDGSYKYQAVDGPLLIAWRKVTAESFTTLCMINQEEISFPSGILPRYFSIGEKLLVYASKASHEPLIELNYSGFDTFKFDRPSLDKVFPSLGLCTMYVKGVNWGKLHTELLILDELNRASVPQVFGELLYALSLADGDMPEAERKEHPVRLQYSQEEFFWPDRLHLIATLNQADRSTEDLDQALQRRFEIRNIPPDSSVLKEQKLSCIQQLFPGAGSIDSFIDRLCKQTSLKCSPFSEIMDAINDSIRSNTAVFDADKKLIGQAIFLKAARTACNTALRTSDFELARLKLVEELKTSLLPQLQAICNNNTILTCDIIASAIIYHKVSIPIEMFKEFIPALPHDHPLSALVEPPSNRAA